MNRGGPILREEAGVGGRETVLLVPTRRFRAQPPIDIGEEHPAPHCKIVCDPGESELEVQERIVGLYGGAAAQVIELQISAIRPHTYVIVKQFHGRELEGIVRGAAKVVLKNVTALNEDSSTQELAFMQTDEEMRSLAQGVEELVEIGQREEIARRRADTPHGLVIDLDEGIQIQAIAIMYARAPLAAKPAGRFLVALAERGTLYFRGQPQIDRDRSAERL